MSLAKFIAQHVPEYAAKAKHFAMNNKGLLAAGAAVPVAVGAGAALEPKFDDFMTDQAIHSMKRNAKRGLIDTLDFADKHPDMDGLKMVK